MFTPSQLAMITDDGNIRKYIGSEEIEEFNVGDVADISFPNGYGKARRVYHGYCPCLNCTTYRNFIVKVEVKDEE